MTSYKWLAVFAAFSLAVTLLIVPSGQAMADEQIRIQSWIEEKGDVDEATRLRLRLKSQLRKETGLSEEEINALDPLLSEALDLNGGESEPVRKMVRAAVQMDCVGQCLMERLRDQNRLMREEQQSPDGEKLLAREQVTTRTRTRDGEQSGDLERSETRTQTRDRDGEGSGDGSGKGR